jgi:hypothetical protein
VQNKSSLSSKPREKISVKNNSESIEQKFFFISRNLSFSSQISFILSGVSALMIGYLESKFVWLLEWKWLLDIFLRGLLTFSLLGIIVTMITPGLLILVFPSLSFAWIRGGLRGFSRHNSWKTVSNDEGFLYLLATPVYFIFGITILYMLVINGWFGQTLISMVTSIKLFLSEWWSGIISY